MSSPPASIPLKYETFKRNCKSYALGSIVKRLQDKINSANNKLSFNQIFNYLSAAQIAFFEEINQFTSAGADNVNLNEIYDNLLNHSEGCPLENNEELPTDQSKSTQKTTPRKHLDAAKRYVFLRLSIELYLKLLTKELSEINEAIDVLGRRFNRADIQDGIRGSPSSDSPIEKKKPIKAT